MRDGLIEEIQALGHWRLNIRPPAPARNPITGDRAIRMVRGAAVQLRGWDFPHVAPRDDESGAVERHQGYVESWCDWYRHREFWRLYSSSQFLAYKALWEDLPAEERDPRRPDGPLLSVQGALWTVIEFFEFSHRLATDGLYEDGVSIFVDLRRAQGRTLWIHEWNRMPFSYPRRANAQDISIRKDLTGSELRLSHKQATIDVMIELFGLFGWEPDRAKLEADQEKFYRKDIW